MNIVGYLKTSLIEWPGKISSVIFTPGCNFRCPFCHNSDLVDPQKIKKQPHLKEEKILADLRSRKKWIDAVVITGGEPTLQSDLDKFMEKIRKLGFKTMIETNGSRPEFLEKLIASKLVDFLAMDYKTTFDDYEKVVSWKKKKEKGKTKNYNLNLKIENSIKLIIKSGIAFEFRTTIVPEIHNQEVLIQMAKDLKKLTANSLRLTAISWVFQSFQPKNCLDSRFSKINPIHDQQILKWLKEVKKVFPRLFFRGEQI